MKLNRAGIVLLSAIGMMISGGINTADSVSQVKWPTIYQLFEFFVISAQLRLSGFNELAAVDLIN